MERNRVDQVIFILERTFQQLNMTVLLRKSN